MTKRELIATGSMATVFATLFLAAPGHAQACPDYTMNGTMRQIHADVIASRPIRIPIPAGGSLNLDECPHVPGFGFVTMRPDLTLRMTGNPRGRQLRFRVESECDAVMLVNTPSGRWEFDDDGNPESYLDPALSFSRAAAGWWDVWLGNHDEPEPCRATLIVSAGPAVR